MKNLASQLLVLAVAIMFATPARSHDLSGKWDLKIEDKGHHVVTLLVVEFTSRRARSCMSGDWMGVTVLSATTKDKDFFPVDAPLSFEVARNQLTIGRNEICDAYLRLSGPLSQDSVRGDYYSFGLGGSTPLGFFTLTRQSRGK